MGEHEEALRVAQAAYGAATRALHLAEKTAGLPSSTAPVLDVQELTVRRINVVEDDGTVRFVIGTSTHGTTAPMRSERIHRPGRHAGARILFVSDDAIECGGPQFARHHGADVPLQAGYIAFDDSEQNGSFPSGSCQDNRQSQKFLEFADQPPWSIADLIAELEEREAHEQQAIQEPYFDEEDGRGMSRLRIAREDDGSVRLILRDAEGRDRLRFIVPSDGEPVAEAIDAAGNVRSIF